MLAHIFEIGTMQCCLIAMFAFVRLLPHRAHFGARLALASTCALVCVVPIYAYQASTISTLIRSPIENRGIDLAFLSAASIGHLLLFIAVIAGCYAFTCKVRPARACYCATLTYLTQDFAYTLFTAILPWASHRGSRPLVVETLPIELLILAICTIIFSVKIAPALFKGAQRAHDCYRALALMLGVTAIDKALGTVMSMSLSDQTVALVRISTLYDLLLCTSVIAAQMLLFKSDAAQRELRLEAQLRDQQNQRYRQFVESSSAIRQKSHDLKHIVGALEAAGQTSATEIAEIKQSIAAFDATQVTGNDTLDAVLAQQLARCDELGVAWTCMADGAALGAVAPMDIFVMVGNALDNAIEAASQAEGDKRFISIRIRRQADMGLMHIENYCTRTPQFKNGMPRTTKRDAENHGFGTASIRSIAEKYHGGARFSIDKDIFSLDVLVPMDERQMASTKPVSK